MRICAKVVEHIDADLLWALHDGVFAVPGLGSRVLLTLIRRSSPGAEDIKKELFAEFSALPRGGAGKQFGCRVGTSRGSYPWNPQRQWRP